MNKPRDLAPETHNSEQEDEPGQAQTVADEVLHPRHTGEGGNSVKRGKSGVMGDSSQDLVDRMRDMERSGRIDMGAYRGEPSMDDEEDTYGEQNRED